MSFSPTSEVYERPPTRGEVVESCPGIQASPTQVRDWFSSYLAYRGLDTAPADKFFWRGAELHRTTYGTLLDAFKIHCGMTDWEADIVAYDIYTIVEGSIPPPPRTLFQQYVEAVFGYENHLKLKLYRKPNLNLSEKVKCGMAWMEFIVVHGFFIFILSLIITVLTARW
ncbi:hypothetical protein F4778DRAFT_673445 [Xylariomycetidae sp. FL2044]|nr:hypothetical protein F4778DRAFT_673445 [Xylariomycetidae sp. FL2044]